MRPCSSTTPSRLASKRSPGCSGADAGGRAHEHQVAGAQRVQLRQLVQDLGHVPDQVGQRAVLAAFAVDLAASACARPGRRLRAAGTSALIGARMVEAPCRCPRAGPWPWPRPAGRGGSGPGRRHSRTPAPCASAESSSPAGASRPSATTSSTSWCRSCVPRRIGHDAVDDDRIGGLAGRTPGCRVRRRGGDGRAHFARVVGEVAADAVDAAHRERAVAAAVTDTATTRRAAPRRRRRSRAQAATGLPTTRYSPSTTRDRVAAATGLPRMLPTGGTAARPPASPRRRTR